MGQLPNTEHIQIITFTNVAFGLENLRSRDLNFRDVTPKKKKTLVMFHIIISNKQINKA
jgi:hypothetical protein